MPNVSPDDLLMPNPMVCPFCTREAVRVADDQIVCFACKRRWTEHDYKLAWGIYKQRNADAPNIG